MCILSTAIGMTEIRPLTSSDFPLVLSWENNPELWKVSEQEGPFSEEEIYSFFNRCLDKSEQEIERWIIETNGEPIGAIDFFNFEHESQSCGIGVFITEQQHRSKGHAYRAMEMGIELLKQRPCTIIRALIYPDNIASIRLFEKLLFRCIGNGLFKGRYVHHYLLEINL
ncbi:MAG: GNAT family N-acetyltransferase [Flavobacteriales bacterium]